MNNNKVAGDKNATKNTTNPAGQENNPKTASTMTTTIWKEETSPKSTVLESQIP